ncbi:hypothetical protein [Streptomonospora litoralis]|uniref:Asp23/Gls24 family envelope stress response protein n=1 Tax=Streptomonospora litoralis TaxID=2498135 RepID=A0A4P6Q1W8_9ACTN|nr:hypothetical protein [Streptomonospora litoralis]QBI52714.1 hypothetical protein EKD16_04535 [Streptomonospora litoralis]
MTADDEAGPRPPADDAAAEARRIAERVRGVPGVVRLSAGPFGTVATPGPGGRVDGVAVRGSGVEVGVVVLLGRPIPDVADEVRETVLAAVGGGGGREVHVSVEDLAEEGSGVAT